MSDYPTLVRAGGSDHNQELKSGRNKRWRTENDKYVANKDQPTTIILTLEGSVAGNLQTNLFLVKKLILFYAQTLICQFQTGVFQINFVFQSN